MIKKIIILILAMCWFTKTNAQQNTILIIADDVSPDYFGSFTTIADTAVAPNIRALANRAVRFSKVWSSPVCSPTRAGIFTGRYPFRTGVGQVITNASTPQLDTSEMSIAKLLKWYSPVKYNTANAGKWHLHINTLPQRLFPNKMGYDFYSGNFNGALTDYYSWTRIRNGIQDTVTTYATTQTVNDAIDWLDTMNTTKPFFLWLAFNAPHSPYHLPPTNLCNTAGLSGTTAHINANQKKYFKAAIEAMDTEIGRLFQYLTANNLMDSTNIIFMGDNGNASQVAQITNTSKAKGTIYDYGVHVPLMVAGPAVVNPNRVSNELINTPDLFATIAELCGFANWKNSIPTTTIIDSKSFLPILKDQTSTNRTWVFTEQFQTLSAISDGKTIRNADYHLLKFDNGNEEFYNQTVDGQENNNLLLGTMSSTDIANYHFLCDTITALTGTGACQPLSIKPDVNKNEFSIYPNPFINQIHVTSNNKQEIFELINQLGQTMYAGTEIEKQDLSGLSKGIYFLKSKEVRIKLIKE